MASSGTRIWLVIHYYFGSRPNPEDLVRPMGLKIKMAFWYHLGFAGFPERNLRIATVGYMRVSYVRPFSMTDRQHSGNIK